MIDSYRTEPLNMKTVCENIVNGISKYVNDNKLKCVVIGLSGGLDSTVCAALCKLANVPIIGISLPCTTNEDCEKTSATLGGTEFCDAFKEINLQPMFESMEKFCTETSGVESTPISQGNIKARLRMITLYDIASKNGGIVIDTDNLTESYLGFWTIKGDEGDFNPIGGLWKHEVYQLANYLDKEKYNGKSEALKHAIALVPTDGNGVKAGGDLAQIAPNKTYDDVDKILHCWVGLDSRIKDEVIKSDFHYGIFSKLCEELGKDIVKGVVMRSVNSEFKRRHSPIVIDVYRGLICEKDGKIIG